MFIMPLKALHLKRLFIYPKIKEKELIKHEPARRSSRANRQHGD